MDNKEYYKIKNRVEKALVKYKGMFYDPEDMAHDVLLHWIQKRSKKGQTIDQAIIDILRRSYGRKNSVSHRDRVNINHPVCLDLLIETGKFKEYRQEDRNKVLKYHGLFIGKYRICFILRFKYGLLLLEIAECFGVTESAIGKWFEEIKEKVLISMIEDTNIN